MKPGSAALILQYQRLGMGYEALQLLPPGVEAYEIIPGSGGCVVILGGTAEDLHKAEQVVPKPHHQRFLNVFSDAVAKAWLGLENPPLQASLIVFESNVVGDVFEAAHRLEKAGCVPFDLRILRGGDLRAYVYATGAANTDSNMTSGLTGELTVIRDPSKVIKSLFENEAH